MSGHVVVIGAGVIGLCSAFYCAQRGWRVTLVERQPEARDGCSFGNTGLVVPSHFVPLAAPGVLGQGLKWLWDPGSPFYLKPRASWDLIEWGLKFWRAANPGHVRRAAPVLRDLSLASRACYEALAGRGNDIQLANRGVLVLCKTPRALDEEAEVANHAAALGLRAEVLDAAGAAALDTGIRMDVAGAVHFPQDCNLVPERLISGLQSRLAAHDVRFAWGTEALGWRVEGDRIAAVKLRAGAEMPADAFVLAAGAWSGQLTRGLGLKIPLQAGKGYSLTSTQPRQLPRMCALLAEAHVAVSPMGSALRFGGTMELGGLDDSVNPIRVRSIAAAVPRYYPDFTPADFANIRPWRGLRPCSPDGLPYIGRTARFPNLAIATGHAMLGMTLGPITGRLVAQLLSDERPDLDLTLLAPDRYH